MSVVQFYRYYIYPGHNPFLGVFFNELIAPIPFFWKVPVLVIAVVIILLLVIMACGYRDGHLVYTRLINDNLLIHEQIWYLNLTMQAESCCTLVFASLINLLILNWDFLGFYMASNTVLKGYIEQQSRN